MKLHTPLGALSLALALLGASGASGKDPRPGLYIRAGESFIFRIEDGQPTQVRPAAEGESPAQGELLAAMSADNGTMLMVSNATGEALNYQAFIAKDEFGKGTRTSVCTLMAGPLAIEHWPQKLPGVRITNFEPAGGNMVCR